jgi:serine/threonine-protein kinase HipA
MTTNKSTFTYMKRCLYCYEELKKNEIDFHSSCSKKIFDQPIPPILSCSELEMEALALQVVKSQMTITGVQPKLSLALSNTENKKEPKRFTIVGLWGNYILKPPTPNFIQLPEVEDVTMHLATLAKIKVVPHSLIRLQSGNLAYITKRIDRVNNKKLQMEDMCQLTERLTENKYHGSYEQIAKIIKLYSNNPGLDLVNFLELVLFSFLTGNADMHLKNFSLITQLNGNCEFSAAYDLVATTIVNPLDDEDTALTLNAKKKKIRRKDFITVFTNLNLDEKQQENIFKKMQNAKEKWFDCIDKSFMSNDFKITYKNLINERFLRITP